MVVHCEFYVCNINRLDIPEIILCLHCQDRYDRGLNPRPSASESMRKEATILYIIFPCVIDLH